ncbi:ribonuclease III [Acetivibrio clariflavus]|uniref:Ribonuclease 3 n=1 Tax=Acetivibrio clariflavus (strain DSM 19732 / NBRC 101661 / EBR45) TaxID=720554 RepID=G8LZ08_ACECE|nr:ribonuclease III [Acetivibrio clariflavus]AEV68952.1 ribonuclease III [Acetivibrio clariflavus DSM 19732]HOQ00724.1 ribonuclease III [Acetivibrio clariflavus]
MLSRDELLKSIEELENRIQYKFKDKNNLILALTHSSYANEYKNEKLISNERLEFLGDSVLSVIVSENIYRNYGHLSEGEMTKFRANVVCEASLEHCALNLNIGKYLLLGKGEELTGGRTRTSILSDAMEALIGAIYIDGGLECAREFVLRQMKKFIVDSINGEIFMDYKTQLQEMIQKHNDQKVSYEIIEEKGPDHNKIFVSQVKLDDKVIGIGEGRTKKEAEQMAAKNFLEKNK